MKEAKIVCPHCKKTIRVREKELSNEIAEGIWAAADEMFKAADKVFKKIFK